MKILLTGGTGGLGREVVRAAEAAGHTVRIASRRARPHDTPAAREWARMDWRRARACVRRWPARTP